MTTDRIEFDDRTRDRLLHVLDRVLGDRAPEAVARIEALVALYCLVEFTDRPEIRRRAAAAMKPLKALRDALDDDDGMLALTIDARMLARGDFGPLPEREAIESYLRRTLPQELASAMSSAVADDPRVVLTAALRMAHDRLGGFPSDRGLSQLETALSEIDRANTLKGRPVHARDLVLGGVVAGVLRSYDLTLTRGSANTESVFEKVLGIVFDDLIGKVPDLKVKEDAGHIARYWTERIP